MHSAVWREGHAQRPPTGFCDRRSGEILAVFIAADNEVGRVFAILTISLAVELDEHARIKGFYRRFVA